MPMHLSMDRCFDVVAFDVRDDRRRSRLGRYLMRHGTRVQLSVFECLVRHHRMAAFVQDLTRFLEPGVDRLTVYPLCHRPCGYDVQVRRLVGEDLCGNQPQKPRPACLGSRTVPGRFFSVG